MSGKLRSHVRSNVIGYVAIFMFAIGGTAYATHPGGTNTISSGDIINGQVMQPDLATDSVNSLRIVDGSVRSAEVADTGGGSLTGVDINESTLVGVNAEQVDGGDLCRTDGVLNMTLGDPTEVICTTDSLVLEAHCVSNDGPQAELRLDTTRDNTFVTSHLTDDPDLDDAEGTVELIKVGDFNIAAPPAVFTGDGSFAAGNPDDKSQIAGTATVSANSAGASSSCHFVVGATD